MNKKDLIIIGGGPAGMSAALVAGRALLEAVVINAEKPRNRVTTASHGFLTRDGAHPLELLQIAKAQLVKYQTVEYKKGRVIHAEQVEDEFCVATADGTSYTTANILFATGCKDDVSKTGLHGIEKVYGKSVYPCPFCDGWEHRGEKLALFGETAFTPEFAKMIANWSDDLIIFTNGKQAISLEDKRLMQKGGIEVIETAVSELLANEQGKLHTVLLADGRRIAREAGFIMDTHQELATDLPEKLGIHKEINDWGMEALAVTEAGKTNVPGVYVVGDARTGFGGLIAAANDGVACVETLVHERVYERWSKLKAE